MTDFYDLFRAPERPAASAVVVDLDPARANRYAASALADECQAVATAPTGTRNHTLNKAAYSISQLVAAGHLPHHDAWDALVNAARAAGLEEGEIDATMRSGFRAGSDQPRVEIPDPPPPVTPTVPHVPDQQQAAGEAGQQVGQEQPEVATWAPVDLEAVLDGSYEPELPSLMPRSDGPALLYPGRVHSFHGESESGKSLIAQAEAARLIADAHDVLFVDFESDHAAVVGRLLELGATAQQIRAHFTYVRPEVDPRRFDHERVAIAALLSKPYALSVVDGVTEALGVFGASTKDNDEITTWMRLLPRTIAQHTGAAVVLVDHVTKDSKGRGRFAIGGQAKMAALDGAAYVVEVTDALGRGRRGMVTLRVAKDRPGGVRAHAGPFRATDRTQEAVRIVVDSTTDGRIRIELRPPLTEEQGAGGFRPTHLMQRISETVEQAPEAISQKVLCELVGGRADTVRKALAILVHEHYVKAEPGPRNALLHTSIQPYREHADKASAAYLTTLDVRPRPTSSHLVPDDVGVTSSQPLRSRAGRDEVNAPRTSSTSSRAQETAQETDPEPPADPRAEEQDEPMLVGCRSCFRPTPEPELDADGRCPRCLARAGVTTTTTTEEGSS